MIDISVQFQGSGVVHVSAAFGDDAGGIIVRLARGASDEEIGAAVRKAAGEVARVNANPEREIAALKAAGLAQDEAERKAAN